jgi:beta-lactam-binding protein with PASTA domain
MKTLIISIAALAGFILFMYVVWEFLFNVKPVKKTETPPPDGGRREDAIESLQKNLEELKSRMQRASREIEDDPKSAAKALKHWINK